jgi:uncharacterized membrane protein YedE/YeeE
LSIKPFDLTGIVAGGVIFGIGMAVLGYCPGTLIVSLGEGAVDALVGIIGGLAAGLLYVLFYPRIGPWLGPYMGKGNLYAVSSAMTALIVLVFGAALASLAFYLDRREKNLS